MSHTHNLSIAVIGGGLGGLAVAIALRRAGHICTVYERAHYEDEIGGAISLAANGSKWLKEWNIDTNVGQPVIIQALKMRKWETGEILNVVDFSEYGEQWGSPYYLFHRMDLHKMLLKAATGIGDGVPVQIVLDQPCTEIDLKTGLVTFVNGKKATHDLVIGADGVGSTVRRLIGITPEKTISGSTCLHANVTVASVKKHNLRDFGTNDAQYWGGQDITKIVRTPCRNGELLSYYCFSPRAKSSFGDEGWMYKASVEELLAPYPDLDPELRRHLEVAEDIRPWRLWVHKPYLYWVKGKVALVGDAAHPLMPDQSQGTCQAFEDAAALSVVLSGKFFSGDVEKALILYQDLRKERATRVQAASLKARESLTERIGFTDKEASEIQNGGKAESKLTAEELNGYDMWADAEQRLKLV